MRVFEKATSVKHYGKSKVEYYFSTPKADIYAFGDESENYWKVTIVTHTLDVPTEDVEKLVAALMEVT